MVESLIQRPNHLEIITGNSKILSGKNILYSHPELAGEEIVISPLGINLVSQGLMLGQLLDKSYEPKFFKDSKHGGIYGVIKKTDLSDVFGENSMTVAVKGFRHWQTDMSGVDQFTAMRYLEDAGVSCAQPLIATKDRMITQWVNSPLACEVSQGQDKLRIYVKWLELLRRGLEDTEDWNSEWRIDQSPHNFAVKDFSSDNVLDWFTVIDPVAIHAAFEN